MAELKTVFIVDDEANIRNGIRYMLNWEEEGFSLIGEAENGVDALKQISIRKPDIILTDLKMPVMDGIELTKIISQDYPDISTFILSSYDDFQSVSQSFKNGAIDYILKPTLTKEILLENLKKELFHTSSHSTIISKKTKLEESFNRYLSGYSKDNLVEVSHYLGSENLYLLYSNLNFTNDNNKFENFLKSIEKSPFVKKSIKFLVNQFDTGLVISTKENIDIREELRKISISNDSLFHLIISNKINDIKNVYPLFDEFSKQSNDQFFYFKQIHLIFYNDLLIFKDAEKFEVTDFLKELIDRNFLLSLTRVESYFNNLILSAVAPYEMKQQASSIFYTLISRIEEEGLDEEQLNQIKIDFIQTINNLNYLEDFSGFILESIAKLRSILVSQPTKDETTLVIIKKYISDNYQQNLSLTDLADKFHFNYNYLSVFLSANLHMSFPDYLKKIRMNEAEKLLLNSDLSLSEISNSVGYSDLSYFSKMFKKEFNMTPSKYRRVHRK